MRKSTRKSSFPVMPGLFAAGAAVYCLWPRRASLRNFKAASIARLETAIWRYYYERDYPRLTRGLYALNRHEYNFSPWDSLRLACYAAKAAYVFQPTRSRERARAAVPALECYFKILRAGTGEAFDPAKAARLELEWWQLRREKATPAQYGAVIAQVTEEIFGVKNEAITEAALLRAEMMDYRDNHAGGMSGGDWKHVEKLLAHSYQTLKSGLARPHSIA